MPLTQTSLNWNVAQRIFNRLRWMSENAESMRHIPLTGRYRNMFRLRIGDYRALYTLNRVERKIIVHAVGHRSEIYRSR